MTTPTPGATNPTSPPFLLPGFKLLANGTRARLGVNAPGPGLLRAGLGGDRAARVSITPRGGKKGKPKLLGSIRRRVKEAGNTYITVRLTRTGRARLRRRGKLRLPVEVRFQARQRQGGRRDAQGHLRKAPAQGQAPLMRAGNRLAPTTGRKIAMSIRLALSVAVLATVTALVTLPTALATAKEPAAGPKIAKCGKWKKKAAKWRCRKQNKANRIAFDQIKNSKFVGTRGDGLEVEETFCANGKLESLDHGPYGNGRSTARRWWIKDAKVRKGGKWINAVVASTEGFAVGYQRRGGQWWVAIASLGRYLEPGKVTKTNAAKECQTLEV